MNTFKPFENDSQSITVGPSNGLTFENGKDKINVYGDFEIKKNDVQQLNEMIQLLTEIKNSMENTKTIKPKK